MGNLVDSQIKNLAPGKHWDGKGLFLRVSAKGEKSFCVRCRTQGKEEVVTLGAYPNLTLKQARAMAAEILVELKSGLNKRREARQTARKAEDDSFGRWALQWHEENIGNWSEGYADDIRRRMEIHLKPTILWKLPIFDLTSAHLASVLNPVKHKQPDTAVKLRGIIGSVCRYVRLGHGRKDVDIVTDDYSITPLKSAQKKGKKKLPAVTNVSRLKEIIKQTRLAKTGPITKMVLFMCATTAQRVGVIVSATWDQFDLEAGLWTIPRENMKVDDDHRPDHTVPLSKQTLEALKDWKSENIDDHYLFPNERGRGHATIENPSKFYREGLKLEGVMVPHGWRTAFTTNMNGLMTEAGDRMFDRTDIEDCVDHETRSKTAQSYDRMRSLPRMRRIMQAWSDLILGDSHEKTISN